MAISSVLHYFFQRSLGVAPTATSQVRWAGSSEVSLLPGMKIEPWQEHGSFRSAEWEEAAASLTPLQSLKDNWDGYGALSVSVAAFRNAYYILNRAYRCGLPAPDAIYPSPSGTVCFEWENEDRKAELEVGETRYVGYVETASGPRYLQGRPQEVDSRVMGQIQELFHTNIFNLYEEAPRERINSTYWRPELAGCT